jgi:hypothetical protein
VIYTQEVAVSTVGDKKAKTDVEKQILSDDTLGWGEFYNNILASNMVPDTSNTTATTLEYHCNITVTPL